MGYVDIEVYIAACNAESEAYLARMEAEYGLSPAVFTLALVGYISDEEAKQILENTEALEHLRERYDRRGGMKRRSRRRLAKAGPNGKLLLDALH